MTAWALWLMPFLFSMSFVEAELLKGDKSDTFYSVFYLSPFSVFYQAQRREVSSPVGYKKKH